MKRLTFEGNFCDIAQCTSVQGGSFCEDGFCSQRKVWERLKEYENAEEKELILKLPCKIGTTIYKLHNRCDGNNDCLFKCGYGSYFRCYENKCKPYIQTISFKIKHLDNNCNLHSNYYLDLQDAEKALKELENEK